MQLDVLVPPTSDEVAYITQALAGEGGRLFLGRVGYMLHYAPG